MYKKDRFNPLNRSYSRRKNLRCEYIIRNERKKKNHPAENVPGNARRTAIEKLPGGVKGYNLRRQCTC